MSRVSIIPSLGPPRSLREISPRPTCPSHLDLPGAQMSSSLGWILGSQASELQSSYLMWEKDHESQKEMRRREERKERGLEGGRGGELSVGSSGSVITLHCTTFKFFVCILFSV